MKLEKLSRVAVQSTNPRRRLIGLRAEQLALVKGSLLQQPVNCSTVCPSDEVCSFYPADNCPRRV